MKFSTNRWTRSTAAIGAAVVAATGAFVAGPVAEAGGCGGGNYPGGQRISWCNTENGWGRLSTTTFWRPGGNPVEAQVVLLKDGRKVPMTVYLDRASQPGPPWTGWVVRGSGFAGTTHGLAYGQWWRGCATDGRNNFMCTGWVRMGG